ncbi:hypothetical protein BO78DRAFT_78400 [Aspergillus sclerotiicarbonarius CBS 121057]|uniref:Uncharacterized protein n=1 Tax=Aspergillus sclerotiicarbonarius (strain CBS 121057 / IBT 28362) TaxID=1448318 RepID=A0A319FJZ0_ASPSB|nr:hypothetical protein BO78DRAFT_78400 [Aspergillus sclerotiicarbonarius CBS 121057]
MIFSVISALSPRRRNKPKRPMEPDCAPANPLTPPVLERTILWTGSEALVPPLRGSPLARIPGHT